MLKQVGEIIVENIEQIVRRWVDELRQSARTETHKQMLTSEIVDSMKSLLVHIASAISAGELPEGDTVPMALIPVLEGELHYTSTNNITSPLRTRPLVGPLAIAQQLAQASGRFRNDQGYSVQEVVYEYIKLREIVWDTLRSHHSDLKAASGLNLAMYVDRVLDEVMTSGIESFHESSIRELEKRAIHDPLTQVYNKEYFQQRLHEEMRRALRYGQALSLVMIDVDRLKEVNDTYGHQFGDVVIASVAKAIADTCRQPDIACRYGGDEFAVILPETFKPQALVFAERVQRAVRNLTIVGPTLQREPVHSTQTDPRLSLEGHPSRQLPLAMAPPSLSIGLATFPEDGRNPETLIARADAALYRAKRGGRNKISL